MKNVDKISSDRRRKKTNPKNSPVPESVPVTNWRSGVILFWIILMYVIFSGIAIRNSTDAIGPDGVSYILLAEHYARGEWGLAICGLWSPLLSWLLVPFIRSGIDPLHGYHFLAIIFGGFFVSCVWLLSSRFRMSLLHRILASVSAAVMAVIFAVATVTPDLLLATLLVLYFYFTLDPDLPRKPYVALLCGATAGVAYLSKAYAAPFFIVHFTLITALSAISQRGSIPLSRWVRSWILGVAVFSLVAAPWVSVLTSKYGHFTYSTAGEYNHAILARGAVEKGHPMAEGIWPIPQGRLNIWEDPTDIPHQDWSPFASWDNFRLQTRESLRMLGNELRVLWQVDLLKLGLAALIFTLIAAFRRRCLEADRALYRWSLITVGVYLSGYLLASPAAEFRYFWPVCVVLLLLVFHYADRLRTLLETRPILPGRQTRRFFVILVILLPLVSFSAYPIETFFQWQSEAPRERIFRDLAKDLAARGVRGPIASNDWTWTIMISYHLREPFNGRAMSMGSDLVDQLRAVGTRTFFVWGPLKYMENFSPTKSSFHLVSQYLAADTGLPTDLSVYTLEARE